MSEDDTVARWDGEAYAKQADHHRALDDWFLDRLRPDADSVVVDLGSGSGEFSARLATSVPAGKVIGIELDPSMLESAQHYAGPNLQFVHASAEELDRVVDHGSVDLVVSRAMLHWLPLESYPRVFEAVRTVLRPGGWFHSESAGVGNVPRVVELINDLAARFSAPAAQPFPDAGVVFELLEQTGFVIPAEGVRTVAQRRSFSADSVLGFLTTQAIVAITRTANEQQSRAIVEAAVADLERLRRADGTFDQTFVRLEILAQRPTG